MRAAVSRLKDRIRATENPFIISSLKHSPKYLGASLFSGFVALVMTKYYTAVFAPAAYGVMALYIALFQYMQNFIAFSVDAAAQRVYFDYEGAERPVFLGTALTFMTGSAVFWVLVAAALAPLVIRFAGGNGWLFAVTIALTIVYMYTNFLVRIAYNEHRSGLVARQGVLQTVLNHSTSVFFIAVTQLGVLGYQLGSAVSYAITGLLYRFNLHRAGLLEVRPAFRKDIMRRLFHFSVPAFFTAVVACSLTYVDRVFLQYFHGSAEVGIYSVGYTLGQGMALAIEAVSLAVFPSLMRELESDYEVNIGKLRHFDLWFCAGVLTLAGAIFLARYPIIALFSNARYALAAEVLPFVVMTFVLGGFYKTVSGVLSYHSIVRFYPALTVFSFTVTALLDYLLVPRFHEIGAAYATFVGVFVYSLVIQLIGSRYFHRRSYVLMSYGAILVLVSLWWVNAAHLI